MIDPIYNLSFPRRLNEEPAVSRMSLWADPGDPYGPAESALRDVSGIFHSKRVEAF